MAVVIVLILLVILGYVFYLAKALKDKPDDRHPDEIQHQPFYTRRTASDHAAASCSPQCSQACYRRRQNNRGATNGETYYPLDSL